MTPEAAFLLATAVGVVLPVPEPPAGIASLLPDPISIAKRPVPPGADATAHLRALKVHPDHQKIFWLQRSVGSAKAATVVFVIPQFHRSETMPIWWTSLGREIAVVQQRIDALVRHLAMDHHVQCVGTEGSSRPAIPYSSALRQLLWYRDRLERLHGAARAAVGATSPTARAAMDQVAAVLELAISDQVPFFDGVGMAQARLSGQLFLDRFGLEDAQTNQTARELLAQMSTLEQELARIDPMDQPADAGIVGEMLLNEYPEFAGRRLDPFEQAMARLEVARLQLREEGLTEAASYVGAFAARARSLAEKLLAPEQVVANVAYYEAISERTKLPPEHVGSGPPRRKDPTAIRLGRKLEQVCARYADVTHQQRERIAAQKLLERMTAKGYRSCAVVMGAGHQAGLVQEIEKLARDRQMGPLAVVVVAPFDPGPDRKAP